MLTREEVKKRIDIVAELYNNYETVEDRNALLMTIQTEMDESIYYYGFIFRFNYDVHGNIVPNLGITQESTEPYNYTGIPELIPPAFYNSETDGVIPVEQFKEKVADFVMKVFQYSQWTKNITVNPFFIEGEFNIYQYIPVKEDDPLLWVETRGCILDLVYEEKELPVKNKDEEGLRIRRTRVTPYKWEEERDEGFVIVPVVKKVYRPVEVDIGAEVVLHKKHFSITGLDEIRYIYKKGGWHILPDKSVKTIPPSKKLSIPLKTTTKIFNTFPNTLMAERNNRLYLPTLVDDYIYIYQKDVNANTIIYNHKCGDYKIKLERRGPFGYTVMNNFGIMLDIFYRDYFEVKPNDDFVTLKNGEKSAIVMFDGGNRENKRDTIAAVPRVDGRQPMINFTIDDRDYVLYYDPIHARYVDVYVEPSSVAKKVLGTTFSSVGGTKLLSFVFQADEDPNIEVLAGDINIQKVEERIKNYYYHNADFYIVTPYSSTAAIAFNDLRHRVHAVFNFRKGWCVDYRKI